MVPASFPLKRLNDKTVLGSKKHLHSLSIASPSSSHMFFSAKAAHHIRSLWTLNQEGRWKWCVTCILHLMIASSPLGRQMQELGLLGLPRQDFLQFGEFGFIENVLSSPWLNSARENSVLEEQGHARTSRVIQGERRGQNMATCNDWFLASFSWARTRMTTQKQCHFPTDVSLDSVLLGWGAFCFIPAFYLTTPGYNALCLHNLPPKPLSMTYQS